MIREPRMRYIGVIGKVGGMMKVYTIEDEKYGLQAVFLDKKKAETACETGDYDISGGGSHVFEWETED